MGTLDYQPKLPLQKCPDMCKNSVCTDTADVLVGKKNWYRQRKRGTKRNQSYLSLSPSPFYFTWKCGIKQKLDNYSPKVDTRQKPSSEALEMPLWLMSPM